MKLNFADEIELSVEKLVYGGAGLAHSGDAVFLVYGALPNEKVRARILKRRKGIWYAETIEVIKPSPMRVKPRCQHFGRCGGCSLQHIEYEAQLRFKQAVFSETLFRIGQLKTLFIEEILPSPVEWGYRNKMEFAFGKNDDGVFLGLHRRWRYDVLLPVAKDCLLIPDDMRQICAVVEELARNEEPYDPTSKSGYLRFLTIRKSFAQNKFLLGVTVTEDIAGELFSFWFGELSRRFPNKIGGGFMVVNRAGSSASGEIVPLFGKMELEENIGEMRFVLSAGSFFQTNPAGAEKLYSQAKLYAAIAKDEQIWDLYCGTGTIGLFIARGEGKLLGVEENFKAVEDAQRNAELNNIPDARFITGDVRKVLHRFLQEGVSAPDVVIIDPPRSGLAKKSVQRIASFSPRKIVYVSCNPSTLARDCLLFAQFGYRTTKVRPVDMFPQTYHIEGVAMMEKIVPEVAES